MSAIERYIFRVTASGFLVTLITLTGVIWVTQALREFDLLTSKGQTVLVFFAVTGLTIPLLILVIAPVALFVAVVWSLGKFNGDSELIVMSAAGISPWRVLRPLMLLGLIVAVIVGAISIHLAPASMRMLRELITKVRADLVSTFVQEGRFTTLENGLTFHVRKRHSDGLMEGLFVDDARNMEQQTTFLAERGRLMEVKEGSFLVLEDGSMQRRDKKTGEPVIVHFERYAFDLSQLSGDAESTFYKPREKYITELIRPSPSDPYFRLQPGRFRAELHERLVAPLYPVAFLVLAFALLGQTRTTRQGRSVAMVMAGVAILALRIAGFAASTMVVRQASAVILVYALPLGAIAVSLLAVGGWLKLEPPQALTDLVERVTVWVERRLARQAT